MTTDVTEEHLGVIEATLTESVAKAAEGLTALAALRRALRAAERPEPQPEVDDPDSAPDPDTRPDLPQLTIVSTAGQIQESDVDQKLAFTVTLTGKVSEPVTVHYAVVAGAEQLADGQAAEGMLSLPDATPVRIELTIRGDRVQEADQAVVVVLGDPEGATIAVGSAETMVIDDDTVSPPPPPPPEAGRHPLFPAWRAFRPRSGCVVPGGPTFWLERWPRYESEIAYIDGFGGGVFGTNRERTRTLELMSGGPLDKPHEIAAGGQMAWMTAPGSFASPFRGHRPNTAWVVHVFETIPGPLANFRDAPGFYDEVARGDHDKLYQNLGIRIADLLQARGIDPELYVGRADHEMQQDFIAAANKTLYQRAVDRIYQQMRRGARSAGARTDLHFAFAPSKERKLNGGDYGPLDSWMPAECDMISMSFHPNAMVKDRDSYLRFAKGGDSLYGLYTDVLEVSRTHKVPIGLLEWGPTKKACVVADEVYRWLYDDFLKPNADRIIIQLVHNEDTITPGAADSEPNQSAAGKAAWRRGVSVYKELFGGRKPPA